MKTITALNQKGGCSKTTSNWALGTYLHQKGYRVLFIDFDAQQDLSWVLNFDSQKPSIYDVISKKVKAKDAIQTTKYGDLIASSKSLAGLDISYATKSDRGILLKTVIQAVKNDYDYCIIDAPPTLSLAAVNALIAADYVVIPIDACSFGLKNIADLALMIKDIKSSLNPSLKILGVLMTKFERTLFAKDAKEVLLQITEQLDTTFFDTVIRKSVAISEAQAEGISIYDYAANNKAVKDYAAWGDEVISMLERGGK